MPAATTKEDLLSVLQKEWGKLDKLIAGISADQASLKDDDGSSIRDVIGHRAHWIDLFLGWYHDGQAGRPVAFPAPGYKWSELKAYNAALRDRQVGMSWADTCAMLRDRHGKLTAFLQELSQDQLYGGRMKGANNNWTTGRWAEAAGPSHYRSAAKYLRTRLRTMAQCR